MPTRTKGAEIDQEDVCPELITLGEDAVAGHGVCDEGACAARSAPDDDAYAARSGPCEGAAQTELYSVDIPAPWEVDTDDSAERHASGDTVSDTDAAGRSSAATGSRVSFRRRSHDCVSGADEEVEDSADALDSSLSDIDADAEDSGDAREPDKPRFAVSVHLKRRERRPFGGEEPQLRLTLRDSRGRTSRPVRLPCPGTGEGMVSVQVWEQDDQPLEDVDMIDLICNFEDDDDQQEANPAAAEDGDSFSGRDDAVGSVAGSQQGDPTPPPLQENEQPVDQDNGEPADQDNEEPADQDNEQPADVIVVDNNNNLDNRQLADVIAAEQDAQPQNAQPSDSEGDQDDGESTDSEAAPVRDVELRGSAGRQRLYRGGNPERRREPPPFPTRLANRRRRLALVRTPHRSASVFVSMISVKEIRGGRQQLFPVTRWLAARLYRLSELDCSLPQQVGDPLQVTLRSAELLHKRQVYSYRLRICEFEKVSELINFTVISHNSLQTHR